MTALRFPCYFTSMLPLFRALRPRFFLASLLGLAALAPVLRADDFNLESARATAAKGDARAQFYLSRCYAHGDGVPQDYARAVEYLRLSAAQGYARAENNLGAFYAQGLGLPQNNAEAAKWFRQAAEQGDPLAEFSLGQACQQGRGVPASPSEALHWYQRAAEQNQTNAILALADLYLGGRGVPVDLQKSVHWFEKAAGQGSLNALNSLGYIYESGGDGVAKNPAQAAGYYRQAAERGFPKGQFNLGRAYLYGLGVGADAVEACKWLYIASRNGEGNSRHYLEELEGHAHYGDLPGQPLTSEQINEAVRRAREFETARSPRP